MSTSIGARILILCFFCHASLHANDAGSFDEEILVVAPTPNGHGVLAQNKLPFVVQSADQDELQRAQALDLSDFLNTHMGSLNINSAQNNPLQADVHYRGFSASPLLGLAQGLAVFQNGARVNEPFGDTVNWDLIPESAVHSVTLIGGSNPLFGLNTLGGALSVEMKDGFNFVGHQAEVYGGAWGRVTGNVESGGNDGRFGYYANVSLFEEDGWRDLSRSDALNLYTSFSFVGAETSLELSYQYADTDLTGNGPAPVGLLQRDRAAVFTAPDITNNGLHMFTFQGDHEIADSFSASVSGFYRRSETDSFNGDGSDLLLCELGAGTFLIEEIDDDALADVGLNEDDICGDNSLAVAEPLALEAGLNDLRAPTSPRFNLDDVSDDVTGTGVLSDSAINNMSTRQQQSYGADVQFAMLGDLFGHGNYFVFGGGYFHGRSRFNSVIELANFDPITRSTAGRGVGTFLASGGTRVATSTATWSLYVFENFEVTERMTLTVGGRYNDTLVELRDLSALRPELNGRHGFRRFNPTLGGTFDLTADLNVYSSYSESSRAPTPIELACNEGVFQVARDAAVARGEDPADIDFECRLPNAFLADPPLNAVIARTIEFGVRGHINDVRHRFGFFRTTNSDDIIFQTTGRGTGLFANVDQTRRMGFESSLSGEIASLAWTANYSYVRATLEDDFLVLSPNHDFANSDGQIAVSAGDNIPGIPANQFKFSADYELPWDIRVGADLLHNSSIRLRGDESNQLTPVDGYTVVNLRATYRMNAHLELFARITNVFDEDYENFGLIGESPVEILPNLVDQRPIFLGSGAPRGAWLGLRARL